MKQKKFYPDYLSEIILAVLVAVEILVITALLFPPAIGRQIDFTRPFQPLPEWYFLWAYQLVRYFPGKSVFVGTVVVPILCILLLMFVPYIDNGKNGRLKAVVVCSVLLLVVVILSILSLL